MQFKLLLRKCLQCCNSRHAQSSSRQSSLLIAQRKNQRFDPVWNRKERFEAWQARARGMEFGPWQVYSATCRRGDVPQLFGYQGQSSVHSVSRRPLKRVAFTLLYWDLNRQASLPYPLTSLTSKLSFCWTNQKPSSHFRCRFLSPFSNLWEIMKAITWGGI